ncbi:5-formyltetrahydrofolate cyclo-ligase [Candidatus Woesearchaeota archaeon]|nr:5-formyltetrahydrofolate cyclo-ligase [Candidatus Woesearchaeota archaeon]
MVSKKQLRKKMLKKRNDLTLGEVEEKSRRIKKNLFTLEEFASAGKVAFYASFNNEVATYEMINDSLPNKKVALPKVEPARKALEMHYITSLDNLKNGVYGISEPIKGNKANLEEIDVIIVPGIAFDLDCNRLGYGKGYYDKLLQNFKGVKIGLAYEFQLVEKIPTKKFDIPLDFIITDERVRQKIRLKFFSFNDE